MRTGTYLYGFTDCGCRPGALRGLADAPVRVVAFGEVAAVVSNHPVQPLKPSRSNLEPHHRIVRQISSLATLVPAAFGHISEGEDQILAVLRGNYEEIRGELARLDSKSEMGLKLLWNVDNIYDFMVRTHRGLRELRDRTFKARHPSVVERMELGSQFEATLTQERERLSERLLGAFQPLTCDVVDTPPREETTVCNLALLIERSREAEFLETLSIAARLFDTNYTLQYNGPWPPYSFVRLRLQAVAPIAMA
jgi:hypothetical protein